MLGRCARFQILGVVCQPDRPQGRGMKVQSCAAKVWAEELRIPVYQPEKLKDFRETLEQLKPDTALVVAYGKMLPSWMLDPKQCFPQRLYNIHASILPRHRGASPIRASLKSGDTETGLTVQQIVKQMDAGDVWIKHTVPILEGDVFGNLYQRLVSELPFVIDQSCLEFPPELSRLSKQDEDQVTFTQKDTPEDWTFDLRSPIDWNHVRAYLPMPGVWLALDNNRVFKVLDVAYQGKKKMKHCTPLVLSEKRKKLQLVCRGGHIVTLQVLQAFGKPKQEAPVWINGQQKIVKHLMDQGVLYES